MSSNAQVTWCPCDPPRENPITTHFCERESRSSFDDIASGGSNEMVSDPNKISPLASCAHCNGNMRLRIPQLMANVPPCISPGPIDTGPKGIGR